MPINTLLQKRNEFVGGAGLLAERAKEQQKEFKAFLDAKVSPDADPFTQGSALADFKTDAWDKAKAEAKAKGGRPEAKAAPAAPMEAKLAELQEACSDLHTEYEKAAADRLDENYDAKLAGLVDGKKVTSPTPGEQLRIIEGWREQELTELKAAHQKIVEKIEEFHEENGADLAVHYCVEKSQQGDFAAKFKAEQLADAKKQLEKEEAAVKAKFDLLQKEATAMLEAENKRQQDHDMERLRAIYQEPGQAPHGPLKMTVAEGSSKSEKIQSGIKEVGGFSILGKRFGVGRDQFRFNDADNTVSAIYPDISADCAYAMVMQNRIHIPKGEFATTTINQNCLAQDVFKIYEIGRAHRLTITNVSEAYFQHDNLSKKAFLSIQKKWDQIDSLRMAQQKLTDENTVKLNEFKIERHKTDSAVDKLQESRDALQRDMQLTPADRAARESDIKAEVKTCIDELKQVLDQHEKELKALSQIQLGKAQSLEFDKPNGRVGNLYLGADAAVQSAQAAQQAGFPPTALLTPEQKTQIDAEMRGGQMLSRIKGLDTAIKLLQENIKELGSGVADHKVDPAGKSLQEQLAEQQARIEGLRAQRDHISAQFKRYQDVNQSVGAGVDEKAVQAAVRTMGR